MAAGGTLRPDPQPALDARPAVEVAARRAGRVPARLQAQAAHAAGGLFRIAGLRLAQRRPGRLRWQRKKDAL